MVEFKAPPPPPQNFGTSNNEDASVVAEMQEPVIQTTPSQEQTPKEDMSETESPIQKNLAKLQEQRAVLQEKFNGLQQTKKLAIVAIGVFIIGFLFGLLMSGGKEEVPAPKGIPGVISNPDIKNPLPRCGQQDSSSNPCRLYIMNHHTYDRQAKDFFAIATTLTGRNESLIDSENTRYRTMRIPAGHFVEIKIPALR